MDKAVKDIFQTRTEAREFGRQCSETKDMGKLAEKLEDLVSLSTYYLTRISGNHVLFQDAFLEYKRNTKNEC